MNIFQSINPGFCDFLCELCRCKSNTVICTACMQSLERNTQCCLSCALPLATEASFCGECLVTPKPFNQSICPFVYTHPLDALVHRLKTKKPQSLAPFLTDDLIQQVKHRYQGETLPDVLVPVPQHWSKQLLRGFNPAMVIALTLSRQLRLPVVTALKRTQRGANQKKLKRSQRLHNLKNVFAPNQAIAGLSVAVVDDVITTGATAETIANGLLGMGASDVHIWGLARTPKH